MYCRNCGKEVHPQAVACPSCGVSPRLENKFCHHCGCETMPNQLMCTKCGSALVSNQATGEKDRVTAGLLAIFLGWLGIHKFYLGYKTQGLIMILVALLGGTVTCGAAAAVMSIIGIIEGITYLTKSNEEFAQTYIYNQKLWF